MAGSTFIVHCGFSFKVFQGHSGSVLVLVLSSLLVVLLYTFLEVSHSCVLQ